MKDIFKEYNFNSSAFDIQNAIENNNLQNLKSLIECLPAQIRNNAITYNNYEFIRSASKNGHTEIISYLESFLTTSQIKKAALTALPSAYGNDHLDTACHFETHLSKAKIRSLIKANEHIRLICAHHGYIDIIKHFDTYLNDKAKRQAVKAFDYKVIELAVINNHFELLLYFENYLSKDKEKEIFSSSHYYLVHTLIRYGYINTLLHIEKLYTKPEINHIVQLAGSITIPFAIRENHLEAIHHLLTIEAGLDYMEKHDEEYGKQYVYPFIDDMLTSLHDMKRQFEEENSSSTFDIDDNKARLYYYVLRNCIRRGFSHSDNYPFDEIRFLLSIPAIKNLAHQVIKPEIPSEHELFKRPLSYDRNIFRYTAYILYTLRVGQQPFFDEDINDSNELLRFALSLGHKQAADLLLELPEVYRLAAENDFYANEARGGLDLRALAQDHESSLTALTRGEQKRLEQLIETYKPWIEKQGVENIIEVLRKQLAFEYNKNPASITYLTKTYLLPLEFEDFSELNWNKKKKKLALEAYYKHKTHTAWRYLLNPNPWMHSVASYVIPLNTGARSTNVEYEKLIALLYLAVIDADSQPTDDYTLNGRWDHFVSELALINRAHNWVTKNYAEQDNLKADQPSCYSGTKRRLFQSVVGHSLMNALTEDILKEEIRVFALAHFKNQLPNTNASLIKNAYEYYVEHLEYKNEDDQNLIDSFDIPPKDIEDFQSELDKKYNGQYNEDMKLKNFLQKTLNSKPHLLCLESICHFCQSLISKKNVSDLGLFSDSNKKFIESNSPNQNQGNKTTLF